MPDWSYRTIFRPVLFRLPARVARKVTLKAMGNVSRLPGGALLIKTLGHMEPAPMLESRIGGIALPTPVGLSGSVDREGVAVKALAQLGFGFVEVGPVTPRPVESYSPIRVDPFAEKLVYPCEFENLGAESALIQVRKADHKLPRFVRIAAMPGAGAEEAIAELRTLLETFSGEPSVAAISLELVSRDRSPEENLRGLRAMTEAIRQGRGAGAAAKALLLHIPLDYPDEALFSLIREVEPDIWSGCAIGDAVRGRDGTGSVASVDVGRDGKASCLAKIRAIREIAGDRAAIFAAAGVHEPADALELTEAGADYLLLHSGFVFSGPGLPKRVNEAILHRKLEETSPPQEPGFWANWGWMRLLGVGMMIGGFVAWLIAVSSVLLPYDESYLGMSRAEVDAINPHLLHFMSHDRITLAGTMLSIGILYYMLARHGLRHGLHWAKTALLSSGVVGFPSFFLYLGYGFFDPVHAAAAAVLFPMFLLSMRNNPDRPNREPVNLRNSPAWRRALWGQLCFIALGFALCVGGIVIATVGITQVFVPEDLAFMNVSREQLDLANARLVPLIAHDRAGFGGALLSDAVVILVFALWGLQQGARWQWWTLFLGGAPGFVAGLSVHFHIGYTDFVHLLPAYFAFGLYVAGLILLYPYLMRKAPPLIPVTGTLVVANQ